MAAVQRGAAMRTMVFPLLVVNLGKGLRSSTFQLNLSRFGHTASCPPV
jgi:hypothetical protein